MPFRRVGISLPDDRLLTVSPLAERLEVLSEAGAGFVEDSPQRLGEIVGGRVDVGRTEALRGALEAARALVGLKQFAVRGA